MLAVIASAAGIAAIIVVLRQESLRRARAAIAGVPPRVAGPDGILVGAEPIRLDGTGQRIILLLHGFGDTPQSVEKLALELHARGWSVRVPLLPAHGRGAEAMARTGRAADWMECARREWDACRAESPNSVIGGLSMGGALAVIAAAEAPPRALVLLAPYLSMGRAARALAMLWPVWQLLVPRIPVNPRRGLRDPVARARNLGNRWFTARLVRELQRVVARAQQALPRIAVPTLVVQARADYRIPSRSAQWGFDRLGSRDKVLEWRDGAGHVLTADTGHEEVIEMVSDWLDARVPRAVP